MNIACICLHAAIGSARNAFFGEGTGPIFLRRVNCRGSESRLIDCPRGSDSDIGQVGSCDHSRDVGTICGSMYSVCSFSITCSCANYNCFSCLKFQYMTQLKTVAIYYIFT